MHKLFISILIVTTSFVVHANKTYTPSQLNQMISSGNYPSQGSVNTTTRQMEFSSCVNAVDNIMSQIRDMYPVKTITNTKVLYMVKAWTNDGAITASCSEPDGKMILTKASYE